MLAPVEALFPVFVRHNHETDSVVKNALATAHIVQGLTWRDRVPVKEFVTPPPLTGRVASAIGESSVVSIASNFTGTLLANLWLRTGLPCGFPLDP
jgi:hypothetical protein